MPEQEDQAAKETANEGDSEELLQGVTESYGTGVQQEPGLNVGGRTMHDRMDSVHIDWPRANGG